MQNNESAFLKKTVVLGVTGCIAAYKSCEIVRGLQKAGLNVKVVMTQHATEFVGQTTFAALTHTPVAVSMFNSPENPIPHITLAQEADLFLIAPCTANVAAKLAHGIADDLLTSAALATTAPMIVAPAMNVHMYTNAATQANLKALQERGIQLVEADSGYLACGDEGKGRLADVDAIVSAVLDTLKMSQDLKGKRVMITAGPTVEPIDPVRYISNYSSGKTGYALAQAAQARGAQVTLISGPVALPKPAGVEVIVVKTACDMMAAAELAFKQTDIAVFSAAVADVRPAHPAENKIKKGVQDACLRSIELIENPDILATLGSRKQKAQVVVGFAAETNDVLTNAQQKLNSKHADFIVANQVGEGKGFGTDDNKVWFVSHDKTEELPHMAKTQLADEILSKALELNALITQ